MRDLRIGLLTREYPPDVYGGGGVHVGSLVPHLREMVQVDVHAFGDSRKSAPSVRRYPVPAHLEGANGALQTLGVNVAMLAGVQGVDLVHSHTWYANMAGHLAKVMYATPHVVTSHSLEPRRPWKAEQLGEGYRLSCWVEETAYASADAIIAVSAWMRSDVLDCYPALDPARVHVVHNGIDTDIYRPVAERTALTSRGIDPDRPMVLFVGRITRQKGVGHLVAAAHRIDERAQVVLCAGAPDNPEIAAETDAAVSALAAARPRVFWVQEFVQQTELRQLLSAATVFVCPSIYEPMGIVNLEAMACETAVVASDVGGIPEIVQHGRTGLLVPFSDRAIDEFQTGLAAAVNELLSDPDRAVAMGRAGRERAVTDFSWAEVAKRTLQIYELALARSARSV